MDKDRKYKEFGFKVGKVLLHILTIVSIIRLYISFETSNGYYIWYLILTPLLIFKLYNISLMEKEAKSLGLSVTEYIDKRKSN